jgi:hypothetical protein
VTGRAAPVRTMVGIVLKTRLPGERLAAFHTAIGQRPGLSTLGKRSALWLCRPGGSVWVNFDAEVTGLGVILMGDDPGRVEPRA